MLAVASSDAAGHLFCENVRERKIRVHVVNLAVDQDSLAFLIRNDFEELIDGPDLASLALSADLLFLADTLL